MALATINHATRLLCCAFAGRLCARLRVFASREEIVLTHERGYEKASEKFSARTCVRRRGPLVAKQQRQRGKNADSDKCPAQGEHFFPSIPFRLLQVRPAREQTSSLPLLLLLLACCCLRRRLRLELTRHARLHGHSAALFPVPIVWRAPPSPPSCLLAGPWLAAKLARQKLANS